MAVRAGLMSVPMVTVILMPPHQLIDGCAGES